jgi:hypothetical protein
LKPQELSRKNGTSLRAETLENAVHRSMSLASTEEGNRSGAMRALTDRISAMAVAGTLLGCGEILGVNDYSIAEERDGGASRTTELPLLPALPDVERIKACEECAGSQCPDQRSACVADERCRALLKCHGECSDPGCIFACRDTHAPSLAFDDYFACVLGTTAVLMQRGRGVSLCTEACGVGRNLACARSYRWRPGERVSRATFDVELSNAAVPGVMSLSTFALEPIAPCVDVAGHAITGDQGCADFANLDAFGRATLTASTALTQTNRVVAMRGNWERTRKYHRPTPHGGHVVLYVLPRFSLEAVLPLVPGYDPSMAIVTFEVRDCLGGSATARVEKSPALQGPIRWYWAGSPVPSTDVELGSGGGFANVPTLQPFDIQAFPEGSLEPLWRSAVVTESGWTTQVDMFPSAAGEVL